MARVMTSAERRERERFYLSHAIVRAAVEYAADSGNPAPRLPDATDAAHAYLRTKGGWDVCRDWAIAFTETTSLLEDFVQDDLKGAAQPTVADYEAVRSSADRALRALVRRLTLLANHEARVGSRKTA